MSIAGLVFPHLTEADPDVVGEGSIDPLGLMTTAERLAETIAPWVTARMTRIRFLTAMAVCAAATEELQETVSVDGTPAYLAFEWHFVTALARTRDLPPSATRQVPGIDKARAVVSRGTFLDSASYLKTPSVFGFNGVFKRLAVSLGIVSPDLMLGEHGDRLLRTWEAEHELDGFADRRPTAEGGALQRQIERWVGKALANGQVVLKPQSDLWWKLAYYLRPDDAGHQEKRLLWDWLTDSTEEMRREVLFGLKDLPPTETEAKALRLLRTGASVQLADRLDAIDAYERVAELLFAAFQILRRMSSAARPRLITPTQAAEHGLMSRIVADVPGALRDALDKLDAVGLAAEVHERLEPFEFSLRPDDFLDRLLSHHATVQANKPPGRRPWFDMAPGKFVVRLQYHSLDEPSLNGEYRHQYRVHGMRGFISELA